MKFHHKDDSKKYINNLRIYCVYFDKDRRYLPEVMTASVLSDSLFLRIEANVSATRCACAAAFVCPNRPDIYLFVEPPLGKRGSDATISP